MEIKQQELTEIKQQVTTVQQSAMSLVVESKADMERATDVLHNVRMAEKYITEKREAITKPQMQALANIRSLFKPIELQLQEANKMIKAKMLSWQIQEDDRVKKEQDRIAKRVEKGTMRPDTAAQKLEQAGEVGQTSEGESGKSSIRDVKKVRITDITMIPREYMEPNMAMITEAIIRKGLTISGVEMFVEKIIVSRSRHDSPNLQ